MMIFHGFLLILPTFSIDEVVKSCMWHGFTIYTHIFQSTFEKQTTEVKKT